MAVTVPLILVAVAVAAVATIGKMMAQSKMVAMVAAAVLAALPSGCT